VEEGERFGIVGESGCGKTTAILALMGLLPPNASVAGQVLLDGVDLLERGEESVAPHRWREISMVFQGAMNAFNPVRTIGEQIVEPMELYEVAEGKAALVRARELLEVVGIPGDRVSRYPHEFSGGMRQRIMIALALVLRPKLLIADEPTTSLDVIVEAQILSILSDLRENFGTALLLITHNLGIVAEACDRVAVMYAGRIVEEGDARLVFSDPAHPYTRELLRSTISLDTTELHSIPGAPPDLIDPPRACRFHPRCPDAMTVCATVDPVEQTLEGRRRVLCWLHGPQELIPPGGSAPLVREEIAVADEA
jgi:peptide/nickel transport system ATP-binding protein